ncbi:MAG: hypothetical protein V1495_10185 [Pseudomonadota bacterium]
MRLRFLIASIAFLSLVSCIKDFNRRKVAPVDRKMRWELFDHGKHQKTFIGLEMSCLNCHPTRPNLEKIVPVKWNGKIYTCHDCHRNATMVGAAPQRCTMCHKDLELFRPSDHRLDWRNRHAIFARVEPSKCATCHDPSVCTDCHLQRNTVRVTAHPRTFLYYHSVEARSDPHKCGSCHQINFCRDCHLQRGVTF